MFGDVFDMNELIADYLYKFSTYAFDHRLPLGLNPPQKSRTDLDHQLHVFLLYWTYILVRANALSV